MARRGRDFTVLPEIAGEKRQADDRCKVGLLFILTSGASSL